MDATTTQREEGQDLRERTGAGDYLGTRCQACGSGEYGLPSVPGDTSETQARNELGPNVERDPIDGRWTVFGAVHCPDCGDTRARWISAEEVADRREEERARFVRHSAERQLKRLADDGWGVTPEWYATLLARFEDAIEESWGPLAEVIDSIVEQDEAYGTPIWGHPYWTTKLAHSMGSIAAFASDLPHPGNEHVFRQLGQVEEVQSEPPAAGTDNLRKFLVAHAAQTVRWILAIDQRAKIEAQADDEVVRVNAALQDNVRKWRDMADGILVPGDDDERRSIEFHGQRSWIALSVSLAPGAHELLAAIEVLPATPDQAEATLESLKARSQPKLVEEERPGPQDQEEKDTMEPQEEQEPRPRPSKPAKAKKKTTRKKRAAATASKARQKRKASTKRSAGRTADRGAAAETAAPLPGVAEPGVAKPS